MYHTNELKFLSNFSFLNLMKLFIFLSKALSHRYFLLIFLFGCSITKTDFFNFITSNIYIDRIKLPVLNFNQVFSQARSRVSLDIDNKTQRISRKIY